MPEAPVVFAGAVQVQRGPAPFSLTLAGRTAAGELTCALTGTLPAPPPPAQLTDAQLSGGVGHYEITAREGRWQVEGAALTVTRAVAAEFYRALPPRPVPLSKRLFWRAVLALAGSGTGVALLRALRGRRGGE